MKTGHFGGQDTRRGFALVITLIMLVLAAVIAVGLLNNAATDRSTARSLNHRYGASLAVETGLEAAKKALTASPDATTSVTSDDSFLVLRADGGQTNASGTKDCYYFLAKARPLDPKTGLSTTIDC